MNEKLQAPNETNEFIKFENTTNPILRIYKAWKFTPLLGILEILKFVAIYGVIVIGSIFIFRIIS